MQTIKLITCHTTSNSFLSGSCQQLWPVEGGELKWGGGGAMKYFGELRGCNVFEVSQGEALHRNLIWSVSSHIASKSAPTTHQYFSQFCFGECILILWHNSTKGEGMLKYSMHLRGATKTLYMFEGGGWKCLPSRNIPTCPPCHNCWQLPYS